MVLDNHYIIQIAALHLGVENGIDNIVGTSELDNFIKSENVATIYSNLLDGKIQFFNKIEENDIEKIVIFTKTKTNISEEKNLNNLQITTICGTPSLSLYETLTKVYSPLLKKQEKGIQKKIASLQSDLRSIIFSENFQQKEDCSLLNLVQSIKDEARYWDILSTEGKDRRIRSSAKIFQDILEPLSHEFSVIEALPLGDVEDLLERSHNVLDDLWRQEPGFPVERIKNLMDIIANDVWKFTKRLFKNCDIWADEFNRITDNLAQGISVSEKWLTTCKQLTEIFWPNYQSNMWKEAPYQPIDLINFVDKLRKILEIRAVHKQLISLSTPEEQEDLKNNVIFEPFKEVDILSFDVDDDSSLKKAEIEFEYLLQPAEKRIAMKLKKQFSSLNANTRQLIYEFSRYSELISRPVLKKGLQSERQFLLTSLHEYVKQIQTQANTGLSNLRNKHQISETIGEIVALRQLESKANEIKSVLEKLLNDLPGFDSMQTNVLELSTDLKHQHIELFESWCSEAMSDINTNKLTLKESDPVVQFSKEKLMRVNYPSRLVTLISEVRQLRAMGYHIPSQIDQTTEHAKKFMAHARTLEQIANFHNTIGDRMVLSQKPMMLSSALELSQLVQQQEVVSWGEEKSVEKYVDTLKKSLEKLSKENNLLTSYHIEVVDKIRDLENADLLKDYIKWRETVKSIRNIVQDVESKGFKNMQNWKHDIDQKLCKVLEVQYIKNLKTLHLNLETIRVDLVFRNSKLEFSPEKSRLENLFEQQLKRYLEIPNTFRGISDNSANIYVGILDRNKIALDEVNKNKTELFTQLDSVTKHWQSWVQLEPLDANKLQGSQDWDLHFRASKTFGQEIAKLPSTEEKVGCFLVGLSRLRSDLESHNRSYWDQLVSSLKDSIAQDVVKLQNYVDPSTATLTKQPVTMQEIGETGMNYNNIKAAYEEMETTYNEMLKKSQVLASWSREQVDAVNRLKGAWERLNSLIDNYQHIMSKQLETIKTTLNIEHENLVKDMERYEAKWNQMKVQFKSEEDSLTIDGLNKRWEDMKSKRVEWQQVLEKKEKLLSEFAKFNLETPQIELISKIEEAMEKEEKTWTTFEEFHTEFNKISSDYWIVIRKKIHIFEDFLKTWEGKLRSSQTETEFIIPILQELEIYKSIIPVLKHVKGEDFTEKHWLDVLTILQIPPKPIDQLILKDFLGVHNNLLNHAKELQTISKKAASEIVIRQALKDIDQWDIQAKFLLTDHKDSRDKIMFLIKEFKDHLNAVGDHQILLQSLKNSADYDTFSEKADSWEVKLTDINYYLSSLFQIQKKWAYLEPIFGSGTLSEEKIRFDKIDKDFRKVLGYIEKDLRVTALCRYPNLKPLLQNILEQLSRCQHSLDNFLKTKREIFPRFLFLSDDDLLEVVGQSSKEQVIQSHLKKIFAGIHCVKLDSSGDKLVSICSLQGEEVRLNNSIDIKQPVEIWLNSLVKEMQSTLKELLRLCQKESSAPDPLKYPSQILCLSESITFTLKCEQAIGNMSLPSLLAKYKSQLSHYTAMSFSKDGTDQVLELKLKSLLLDTIYHISIMEELLSENVSKTSEWCWQKHLRFYSNSLGEVTVKMANARMDYSYEYLGNYQKLVRTPLTEKCFLTLTQAMHLGMGGNPYGPAGTGKTESVKDLGALLGRQVLVFNCDESIDTNSMARILTGLVKTGAWGCFDEFNRLDEATLSAISMIIQPIQSSLQANKSTVFLLEQDVPVDKHCGIFVTLNPAGSNYGGRNKLPDNLKQLFRPVVMSQPDNEQIARTLLYCEGFQHADIIAKKLVEVFKMASNLMSKQRHYDWGLRAIKSVLSGCGFAMKKLKLENSDMVISKEIELSTIVGVLRMDVTSKLTLVDGVKFEQILRNVFKEFVFENVTDEFLVKTLHDVCNEMNIIVNDRQVTKCMEFYEQLKQRMGVAVVGPPKSGKSTIINLVLKALSKLGTPIKTYTLNPKSMSRQLLLGTIDNLNQWNDGVLTNFSLKVASEPSDVKSWIICDGDIDPDWIESLNSVLDDNRLLSLPSGWRIQFGPNVNFIFETHNFKNASPATISRIGIIYLNSQDMEINNYLEVFLKNLPETNRSILEPLVNDYFLKSIQWVLKEGELNVPRSPISIAKTGLCYLTDVMSKTHFAVALINGLGEQLHQDFREIFAQQIFDWLSETPPPQILNSFYDTERDLIDTYHPQLTYAESNKTTLILTAQVQYYLDLMKVLLRENSEQNFLIYGPHGSAKTLMINYIIEENSLDILTINCSANLPRSFVIQKLIQHCLSVTSHKGKILKPKKQKLVVHLRNIHLLKHDKWGSSEVIEFLSQLVEYHGFFDRNANFITVENVTIIGTFSYANKLSTRFLSKLHLINVNTPDREDLSSIIVSYITPILKIDDSQTWAKAKILKLASTIISIYEKVKSSFPQSYFNPHDIVGCCKSLRFYKNIDNDDFEKFILEISCYEALQRFGDRLALSDSLKFYSILDEIFKSHWGISNITQKFKSIFYIPSFENSIANKYHFEKLNEEQWQDRVEQALKIFERENQELSIVVNKEILLLTAAILRSSSAVDGHLLFIGKTGVGRKTSLKIASALQNVKLIKPSSGKSPYFYNDLKIATNISVVETENVYLLLEDYLFLNESNLNAINLLISSGEVPDLYTDLELDSLTKGLKEKMESENFEGDVYQFFIHNIRNHLHVIICFDERNQNLLDFLSKYPAFSQICNLVWCNDWSEETIKVVSAKLVEKINSNIENNGKFSMICNSVKSEIATPSRYISFIKTYCKIYDEQLKEINSEKTKLEAGVFKLHEAKTEVSELKKKAEEQQEKLAEKQSKANAALDMISHTMKDANSQKEEMESLKQRTEDENVQLVRRKGEIEVELAEVEPLIQQARAAVGNIKSESLSEIRSLRAPPEVIRDILEGVLRLMGIQDTSWNSMKTFLAKRGVKEDIRSFDASRIQTENRVAVERLLAMKKDSFDPKSAKRASVAAAPLASWVEANVKYSKVLDKIRPLEIEQNKLKENLMNKKSQLGDLTAGLQDVDVTVAKLKEQLSMYTKEAAEIEISLNAAQKTLNSAESLVSKLDDEFHRWQEQLVELSQKQRTLPDVCLLAAAFIAYLTNETISVRQEFLTKWCKELNQPNFSFEKFFTSERHQLQWQTEGLSSDLISFQNAIIIQLSLLVPLIIDPTSKALHWFYTHNKLKRKNIESVSQNSPKFNTVLENAIRFGKLLVVEDVETDLHLFFSLLRDEFTLQGERKLIKINNKLVDLHPDFKLILCSRNEQLQIPADVLPFLNVMNFNVTYSGLKDQLLDAAVKQENPETEQRRKELLHEKEEFQERQHQLQNELLNDLATSSGNILNNKSLLSSLTETKASSLAIAKSLEESKIVEQHIEKEYRAYESISDFGSQLYFACNDLVHCNFMYLISTSAYINLFLRSLQTSEILQNSSQEVQKKHLLHTVYQYMSRGIFKNDRLTCLLHLVNKLYPKEVSREEINLFLGISLVKSEDSETLPPWIPKNLITSVQNFKSVLPEVYSKLQLDESTIWKGFMTSSHCEKEIPAQAKLTSFQKVLLTQSLRPDRLHTCLEQFLLGITGLKSIDPPVLELEQILKDSHSMEPILFLIASGTDPTEEIKDLSKIHNVIYTELAMGEGQEAKAIQELNKCAQNGHWLVLKNLHLVTYWLPTLLQAFKTSQPADGFRIWLITEPTEKFNHVLAQNSLKIAYEDPPGLKNNILRIYSSIGEKFSKNQFSHASTRLLFVFSCFHALLQERRIFIPQGWSKYYEFSNTDLDTCLNLTEDYWQSDTNHIKWKFIIGLACEAIYGGRVENPEDLKILESYSKKYFKDEVLSHRWKPFNLSIALPSTSRVLEYLSSIKELPNKDEPSMFGLPDNIVKAWEKKASADVILKLKKFYQPGNTTATGNKEFHYKNLAPFLNLWKKVNQGHEFIRMSIPETKTNLKTASCLELFIEEEFLLALTVIQTVHKSFTNLNKISKGNLEADDTDKQTALSLLMFETPQAWTEVWRGPKDPTTYMQAILSKAITIFGFKNQDVSSLFKEAISLSQFFYPEAFLAATKQQFSQTSNVSLDDLLLESSFTSSNSNSIVLKELLIEGAIFENKTLMPCTHNSESINNTPLCYLSWTNKKVVQDERMIHIPVYENSLKENKIMEIQVPCTLDSKDRWIQAGVAFYLDY